MNTNVKGTNLTLTDSIQNYLDKKMEAFSKFIEDESSAVCGVELARDTHHQRGDVFRCEITLQTPHNLFRVSEEGETVYSAIDVAQAELVRELRREKRKRVHLIRRGGQKLKEITQRLSERGVGMKDFFERFRK